MLQAQIESFRLGWGTSWHLSLPYFSLGVTDWLSTIGSVSIYWIDGKQTGLSSPGGEDPTLGIKGERKGEGPSCPLVWESYTCAMTDTGSGLGQVPTEVSGSE